MPTARLMGGHACGRVVDVYPSLASDYLVVPYMNSLGYTTITEATDLTAAVTYQTARYERTCYWTLPDNRVRYVWKYVGSN